MTSIEVEEEHPFLDLDHTIFPHFQTLHTPSLNDLYAKVEQARVRKLAAAVLGAIATATSCALFTAAAYTATVSLAAFGISCLMYSVIRHKPKPYLILSIDGGGIRGAVPAQILAYIEKEVGCKIGQLFDCITGTSIGGILALCLALPDPQNPLVPKKSARDMVYFFVNSGPSVFESTSYQNLVTAGGVVGPKYSNEKLKNILEEEFQDTKLSEAVTDIVIPSYDLCKGKPLIFCHFKEDHIDKSFLMKDVCLGTAAAPVYFPSHPIVDNGHSLNVVDGGLIANNPSLLAFMKATGQIEPGRDIFILSVGTGNFALQSISYEESRYFGMWKWLPMIFDLLFQTAEEMLTLQFKLLKHFGGVNFSMIRLQPELESPEQAVLDNASIKNITDLCKLSLNYCKANADFIQKELVAPLKKYRALKLGKFEEIEPINLDDFMTNTYP